MPELRTLVERPSAPADAEGPEDVEERTGAWRLLLRSAQEHPVRATAVVGAAVAVRNLLWIRSHRFQGGFDGDETSYLSTAMRFRRTLDTEGVGALAEAAVANHRNGPLTSLLSALVLRPSNPIHSAMAIQPVLHVVAALAIAALVRRMAGGRAALVAGVVALGLPAGILAARAYQLVPAATASLCVAVLALVASDRGRRAGWMLTFGAAVGAMLISRTMTVAFLPGLAVATLVVVERNRRSLASLAGAAAATLVVAAPWWIHEWDRSIYPYLFRYGYGQGAGELGPANPILRALVRLGLLSVDVRHLLALPALLICVLGARGAVRHLRRDGRVGDLVARHRELTAVWAVVVVGWCCLLTSSNMGTWFQAPLEVLAVAAVVATGAHLPGRLPVRVGRYAVAIAAANVVLIGTWQVGSSVDTGQGGSLSLSLFGGNETSHAIDFQDGDSRFRPTSTAAERRRAMDEWAGSANGTAAAVDELTPPGGQVMQTFIGDVRLFMATTLELAEQVTGEGISPWEAPNARSTTGDGTVSLEPVAGGGLPRILVAVRTRLRVDQEGFSPEPILAEARERGWVLARRVPLPDGGTVDLYTHPASLPGVSGS